MVALFIKIIIGLQVPCLRIRAPMAFPYFLLCNMGYLNQLLESQFPRVQCREADRICPASQNVHILSRTVSVCSRERQGSLVVSTLGCLLCFASISFLILTVSHIHRSVSYLNSARRALMCTWFTTQNFKKLPFPLLNLSCLVRYVQKMLNRFSASKILGRDCICTQLSNNQIETINHQ